MPLDFMGGLYDGVQLSKEECELRYLLMRLELLTAKKDEDRSLYRTQAFEFRRMGRLSAKESAELRRRAEEMFGARKPAAHHVH